MSQNKDENASGDAPPAKKRRNLKDAIAVVKNRDADRSDVVVDLKTAERSRLELMADEMRPFIDEIDEADERFDFALSMGEKPRLWIDMTSFVSMGHDKRSYRFLKDTRMGRIVLAESNDMQKVADIVSDYVAERVLERERAIEGEWVSLKDSSVVKSGSFESKDKAKRVVPTVTTEPTYKRSGIWHGFLWFLFGAFCCIAGLAAAIFMFAPDAL